MSSGNKTLLVLAGIAMLLVVGAFSAFMILVRDESSPPDDSDLILVRPTIPDDQNAWTYYAKAVEKLSRPQGDDDNKWPPAPGQAVPPAGEKPPEKAPKAEPCQPPPNARDRWNAIVFRHAWEQPLVDEVLARNAEALALWRQGLAAPECLVPEANSLLASSPCWGTLNLVQIVAVRVRNLSRQGEDEAAMEEAMRLVRFGHQMEGGRGVIVEYMVGTTSKRWGCELMQEWAPKCRLSPDRLRRCAADLANYQAMPQALAATLRAEYTCGRNTLDKVASGEMDIGVLLTGDRRRSLVSDLEQLLYKPNRTRRLLAEICREMIAAAPKHFADMPDFDRFRDKAGNPAGEKVLCIYEDKCQTNVQLAVTRVLLAMKAFKLEKGRLPATLDELVPDYLDAVPLDDFDGKPLRYNPAKKIVYTVGKDTKKEYVEAKMKERCLDPKSADPKDVEDIEGEFLWKAPNPAFPIDF